MNTIIKGSAKEEKKRSVIKQSTLSEDKKSLIVGTVKSDLWETPKWLLRHYKNHFDPCPPNPIADGRLIEWKSPSFVNPPYSNAETWVDKAIMEQRKGIDVVMLLKVDPSTGWYRKLIEAKAHIAYFNERIYFSGTKGSNRPNFASMLVFLEGNR